MLAPGQCLAFGSCCLELFDKSLILKAVIDKVLQLIGPPNVITVQKKRQAEKTQNFHLNCSVTFHVQPKYNCSLKAFHVDGCYCNVMLPSYHMSCVLLRCTVSSVFLFTNLGLS